MKTFWIIGMGRFGSLALDRLCKLHQEREFILVDPIRKNLHGHNGQNQTLIKMDGVAFLHKNMSLKEPDWIIPALPIHLAAELCLLHFGPKKLKRFQIPSKLDPILPNPTRGDNGDLYVSHAVFKCPDNCPESPDFCTVTQQKRKPNMFDILKNIKGHPFHSSVLRSHQLCPGIGGYRPDQIFRLFDNIMEKKGRFLISTACRCHGVVTGIDKIK